MFGYIKPFIPELKVYQYEEYKGVYCTLCKALNRDYGILGRLTLSYDSTFLSLLILGLKEEKNACFTEGRCPFNPTKKCKYCVSELDSFSMPAAVTVTLFYYKLLDNIDDSKGAKKLAFKLLSLLYKGKYKKAQKLFPLIVNAANDMYNSQKELENADIKPSLDRCADASATMLGQIMHSLAQDGLETVFYRFGYMIGRFVYIADASDDLVDDIKENSFNPLLSALNETLSDDDILKIRENANKSLNITLSEALNAYNLMTINRFSDIIENILQLGLPQIQKQILENEKSKP